MNLQGEEAVLAWYDENVDPDYPNWSIWMGKTMLGRSKESSEANARAKLQVNLMAAQQNGYDKQMSLRLHDAETSGRLNNATSYYALCYFYPTQQQMGYVSGSGGVQMMNFPNNPRLQELAEKVISLESRMTAMEAEFESEDSEGNRVGNAENPWLQLLQHPMAIGLINKVIPGIMDAPAPMGSIGQVPDSGNQQEKLNQAILILGPLDPLIGDHLLALAIIARDQPDKYKMALTLL